jgi:hypothetical protein
MAIALDKQTTSTSCNSSSIFHNSAMTVIHGNPAHARSSAINLRCYSISSTILAEMSLPLVELS